MLSNDILPTEKFKYVNLILILLTVFEIKNIHINEIL